MKTVNIAKTLSALTFAALTLASGASFAHGPGNPYMPVMVPVHPDAERHFDHDRGPAPRHDGHADVDARQRLLVERIRDGIDDGRISRHEARDLYREQRAIEITQRRYLADGRLSRDEWESLDRMLDRAAANIRAEKRDRDWR